MKIFKYLENVFDLLYGWSWTELGNGLPLILLFPKQLYLKKASTWCLRLDCRYPIKCIQFVCKSFKSKVIKMKYVNQHIHSSIYTSLFFMYFRWNDIEEFFINKKCIKLEENVLFLVCFSKNLCVLRLLFSQILSSLSVWHFDRSCWTLRPFSVTLCCHFWLLQSRQWCTPSVGEGWCKAQPQGLPDSTLFFSQHCQKAYTLAALMESEKKEQVFANMCNR